MENLNYPNLYKGELFEDGYNGCRLFVVGHQAPATPGEEGSYKYNWDNFVESYKNNNFELVKKDIIDEGYKDWKKEDRRRTNTWQKFINIIHYPNKPSLDSVETKDFLRRIAFANYLTKPCFNKNRMGNDAPEFYTNDLVAFKQYINEAFANNDKPNVLIVWGNGKGGSYPHIQNYAKETGTVLDETHCVLVNKNGAIIYVINIKHPMCANQNNTHTAIEHLLQKALATKQ